MGGHTVFTPAEEQRFVNYIIDMQEIGYPLEPMEFRWAVKKMLDMDGRKTPFCSDGIENLPGKHWYNGFMTRHIDQISVRKSQTVNKAAACVTMGQLENWYKGCVEHLSKIPGGLDALADPRRKFNADETGCPLDAKTNRIGKLARRGAKQVYQVQCGTKQQITVEMCFNAAGEMMPPFFVFPGQRMSTNINISDFPEAYRTVTSNGWMDQDTFINFLERFDIYVVKMKIKKPVILFIDGHTAHLSLEGAKFARDKLIILYCLPENATRISQPADVGLYSQFKLKLPGAIRVWQANHMLQAVTKYVFPEIFKIVWDQVNDPSSLQKAFKHAGIHPFGVEHIEKARLLKFVQEAPPTPASDVEVNATSSVATVSVQSAPATSSVQVNVTQSFVAVSVQSTPAQASGVQVNATSSFATVSVQSAPATSSDVQVNVTQSFPAVSVQSAPATTSTVQIDATHSIPMSTLALQGDPVQSTPVPRVQVNTTQSIPGPLAASQEDSVRSIPTLQAVPSTSKAPMPAPSGGSGDQGTTLTSSSAPPESQSHPPWGSGDGRSAAAYMRRPLPPDYVSPAIDKVLQVPQINPRPAKKPRLRTILPKCVSGEEAIKIMEQRKHEAEALEKKKEENRVMRETIKRMKKEEMEKKRTEREEAKKKRQEEKEKKRIEKEERKRKAQESKGKGKKKGKGTAL